MKRALFVVLGLLAAAPVLAQNANQAQLRLVVVDQTGAGIPSPSSSRRRRESRSP
jgi:hypothetical protein